MYLTNTKLDYPCSALTNGLAANIALRCSPKDERNTYSDSKWKQVMFPVLSITGIVPFLSIIIAKSVFFPACKAGMLYQAFFSASLSNNAHIHTFLLLSFFVPLECCSLHLYFFPICLFFFLFFSARPWLCAYSNSSANIMFFYLFFLLTASPILLLHPVWLD